jgi:hypothetical protein
VFEELKRRTRADRRRDPRHSIRLPVEVQGLGPKGILWKESSETINVSSGGMAIRLATRVMVGDTLFVQLPLPEKWRKKLRPRETYATYAVVRHIELREATRRIVRLQFFDARQQ